MVGILTANLEKQTLDCFLISIHFPNCHYIAHKHLKQDNFENVKGDLWNRYHGNSINMHHQETRFSIVSRFRRCLHDTRSSFIPVRLHPGSILSICICLHDSNQNCIPERVIPERLHSGSRIGSKFSFQNEICLHVPLVSCKGGTGSFRYGSKQVDWLGWPADSCFRSVDAFTAFSFQNEKIHVNVKQTMRVVLEWNSFRYHVNTTLVNILLGARAAI